MQSGQPGTGERLVQAYRQMLARVKTGVEEDGERRGIRHYLDMAREKAVELGELSREEAERIAEYVQRDVRDAAEYLSQGEKELRDWMRFDVEMIEARILDVFSLMVDHTRLEFERLAQEAQALSQWQTGEITGPGTLQCERCAKPMHFHQPGRIPPCPHCHATRFQRVTDEETDANNSAAISPPPEKPA